MGFGKNHGMMLENHEDDGGMNYVEFYINICFYVDESQDCMSLLVVFFVSSKLSQTVCKEVCDMTDNF